MNGWPPPSRPVDDDGLDGSDSVADFYDDAPASVPPPAIVDPDPVQIDPDQPARATRPAPAIPASLMPGQTSAIVVILALAAALAAWLLLIVIGAPAAGPGRALITAAVALSVASTGLSRGPAHRITALSVVVALALAALAALSWWVCAALLTLLAGLGFASQGGGRG